MEEPLDYGQLVELYGLAADPELSGTVQAQPGFALVFTGTLRAAVEVVDRWSPLRHASAIIRRTD